MEVERPVCCGENEAVARYFWNKRQEMEEANGVSEKLGMSLSLAYRNICAAKTPITTLKDLSQIRGVGKWILRLMQGFFQEIACDTSPSKIATKGKEKQDKGPKRYMPKKNSVAYALLITLYRAIADGTSYMKKQELIDAAEASGLSRTSIAPDKNKGPGQFGGSTKDWYTGWSCMKTLLSKGLVVKSSCPAKYMLTQEGQEAARECLMRSGLADSGAETTGGLSDAYDAQKSSHVEVVDVMSSRFECESTMETENLKEISVPNNFCKNIQRDQDDSARIPPMLCRSTLTASTSTDFGNRMTSSSGIVSLSAAQSSAPASFRIQACNSSDIPIRKLSGNDCTEDTTNAFPLPPCRYGENFQDIYDVILILDDRENFGSRSKKVVDNIQTQFKILVEVRRLPVGDGIWIARHKTLNTEYVLDFIVERKKVDDLCSSIRDNRYRDQKLRIQRCGLRKLIYLVEGDPNCMEAAESIKSACFTTEILEGFDVQRTSGFADTVRKYGHLTQSIIQYYRALSSSKNAECSRCCPSYDEFVKKCQDLEKITISDVFALQLMQVPQVTEEIALAVLDLYPTLFSLVQAYIPLEGNIHAQEELLKSKCKIISAGASRNIFKLVWGS